MKRIYRIQVWVLFAVLLANFAAQVVYFYHLYYTPQDPLPVLHSSLLMGAVFVLFLVSFGLFMARLKAGYPLLVFYLALEFSFYLVNFVANGLRPGLGWFFHLREPDPVLWAVFFVGYVSMFASGYFLVLLLARRRVFDLSKP